MLRLFHHWQEFRPGDPFAVQYTPVELEELERCYRLWVHHRELLKKLDDEFNLGEFGYVNGDLNKFKKVQEELRRKKMKYIEEGEDEEAKMVRSYLWPYRDTLQDNVVVPRLCLS